MSLTVEDLEKIQTQLTEAHLDYRTDYVLFYLTSINL